jgi:hypothetical protein
MATEPQMITANRLVDGAVVYFTIGKSWSESFADGAVWTDQESADSALTESKESVKARIVVEPYLFDVAMTDAGPTPASVRERIRADHNPTVAPDQGSWTGRISD